MTMASSSSLSSSVCYQSPVMQQELFSLDPYQYEPSKPCITTSHRLLNVATRDRLFNNNLDQFYAPSIIHQSQQQQLKTNTGSVSPSGAGTKRILSFRSSSSNSPKRTTQFNSALLKMKQKGPNSTLQRLRVERDNGGFDRQQSVPQAREASSSQLSSPRALQQREQSLETTDQQVVKTQPSSSNDNPSVVSLGRPQRRMSLNARTA